MQALRVELTLLLLVELAADLLHLCLDRLPLHLDLLGDGQGFEGHAAAQALLRLGPGGVHQAAHQVGGEQLLHIHALLGDLSGGLLQQVDHLPLHHGLRQLHLQLVHQGGEQGAMAGGLAAPLGLVLQLLLQLGPQLRQGLLVAGPLGEGVIQGWQFAALQLLEGHLKAGLAPGQLLLLVAVGEAAVDRLALAHRQADHPIHEAGDHAPLLQLHLEGVAAATGNRLAAVAKYAAETQLRHVAGLGRATLHRHQGGQLTAGLLDQLIHPGRVVNHRLHLRLETLGGLQAGGGLDIEFQGDGELAAGLEALQHQFQPLAELGAAEGSQGFNLQGLAIGGFHQVFQGRGQHPFAADLLQQNRPGHLALAEARQLDAAAELADRRLVAGLAEAAGDGQLQRHATGRTGAHLHLQLAAGLAGSSGFGSRAGI